MQVARTHVTGPRPPLGSACFQVPSVTTIWSFCLLEAEQWKLKEMSDSVTFRFWAKTEVVNTQAKNQVWASHVLSLLAITVAKQILTSYVLVTSAIQNFGVFLCLLSLRMLGYPCALHLRKKDQVLVPEAKRGWKCSGFVPGVGCSAMVSSLGLAGFSSKCWAGEQRELQLMRRWEIPAWQQVHCERRHCVSNSL